MNKLIGRKVKLVLPSTAMCVPNVVNDRHLIGEVIVVEAIDDLSLPPFNVVCRSVGGWPVQIDRYCAIQLRYLNNKRVKL